METLQAILPVVAASGLALGLLLLSAFFKWRSSAFSALSSALLTLAFLYPLFRITLEGGRTSSRAFMAFDGPGIFFSLVFFLAAIFTMLLLPDYLEKKGAGHLNEIYPLVIFSFTGMVIMATANHFLMFFLGLELMSICFYVLAGILREQEFAVESSLKYFILGVFSSALLLMGIGLVYGSASSLSYAKIAEVASSGIFNFGEPMMLLGFVLVLAGLFFKLSLVPFHFWAPDVYQGAPTPVTALLSVGGKAAAVAATMRFYTDVVRFSDLLSQKWLILFSVIGLVTVFTGSFIALTQVHLKRLLAYSSVVHAGFLALGLGALAGDEAFLLAGEKALAFYVAAYLFMNVASFACASAVEKSSRMDEGLLSLSGLGSSSPVFAALLAVNFLSLAGIPPTAGFLGKFYVFSNLVAQGSRAFYWIAALGLIGAVVATFYYLKVLVILYFPQKEQQPADPPTVPFSAWLVVFLCTALTLLLGVFPQFALNLTALF